MNRTTFIAPVESMRGNLSGKQDLRYANENNKAFDAPEGRQYARNYRASYIGARRAKDGLCYFSVKTKSATNISSDSLKRMACLGATGAMIGSILNNKESNTFKNLLRIYGGLQIQDVVAKETSFRKWLFENIYVMFDNKLASISLHLNVGQTHISQTLLNVFVGGSQTDNAKISPLLISKFWLSLAPDGLKYRIAGTQLYILAHKNETFSNIIDKDYNVAKLYAASNNYIMFPTGAPSFVSVTKSSAVEEPFSVITTDEVETSGGGTYFLSQTLIEQGE